MWRGSGRWSGCKMAAEIAGRLAYLWVGLMGRGLISRGAYLVVNIPRALKLYSRSHILISKNRCAQQVP